MRKVLSPYARRYDREIFYLALPALGTLAAEPSYVLVDTAIVGHLGTPQLAALAIAATLLSRGLTPVALIGGIGIIPRAFTGDPAMIEHARALWPLFALMQPAGAAVFALDGILIGASDTRFLKWSMVAALACFAPLALAALALHLGVVGVWVALDVLMAVRLITCGARFVGRRWAAIAASTPGRAGAS